MTDTTPNEPAPTTRCTSDAIVAEVTIAAPRDLVWRALTDGHLLAMWWGSEDTYRAAGDWKVDLRPGGRTRRDGCACSAGSPRSRRTWRQPKGDDDRHSLRSVSRGMLDSGHRETRTESTRDGISLAPRFRQKSVKNPAAGTRHSDLGRGLAGAADLNYSSSSMAGVSRSADIPPCPLSTTHQV
jgi:hypothetical protein